MKANYAGVETSVRFHQIRSVSGIGIISDNESRTVTAVEVFRS